MPEDLRAFRERTAFVWDSLPREGCFATHPQLEEKVGADGRFRPFFGDTVIFDLPEEDKSWLSDVQRMLYARCGDLLAAQLDPVSFHITLHDLNCATEVGPIASAMASSREATRALLATLPADWSVAVRSTAVFSMVNTSIVMGFEPVDEACCAALMGLYETFQQVVPLNYPLTPHVTLAYDCPMKAGEEALRRLRETLAEINREVSPRVIRLGYPRYSTFTDMNHYHMEP